VMALPRELTGGRFADGANARILARELFVEGRSTNVSGVCVSVAASPGRTYEAKSRVGLFIG